MSKQVDYRYQIERERRRKLHLERVRATVMRYLDRYRTIMQEVQTEGLAEHIADEFAEMQVELRRLDGLASSDPEAARDLGVRLNARIFGLPAYARGMRRAAQEAMIEAERRRKEEQARLGDELERVWQEELLAWKDGFARNLAFPALAELRKQFLGGAGSNASADDLISALRRTRVDVERQAADLREAEARKAKKAAIAESMGLVREEIAKVSGQLDAARQLEAGLAAVVGLSDNDAVEHIFATEQALDAAIVDESCRREVVQAIQRTLEEAGFATEKPRRIRRDGIDEVLICGQRMAGGVAEFKVSLSGALSYKFDGYQGAACRKDIGLVMPRLRSAYGIELSDEVVRWSNPDDNDSEARPQPGMTRER